MPIPLHWHTEPLLLISIIGCAWLYAVCTGPLRQQLAPTESFSLRQAVMFFCGVVVVYIAVGSPIDQLGEEYLFSMHMVQHMLLIYAAPPLIIRGVPVWLTDFCLKPKILRRGIGILVHPVTAALLFNFIYTVWHIPALYEVALQDKFVHIVEHWTLFFAALLFWWPIISHSKRLPPISYGARMFYAFVLMVAQLPVFAFLCFSGEVLYPTYEFAPRIIPGFGALADQILGGVIMKIVNMIFAISVLVLSWMAWYRADEENAAEMIRNFRAKQIVSAR